MGAGVSLLPEPDARTTKVIAQLELRNSELADAFHLFQRMDLHKEGAIEIAKFYSVLGERKSIFGDSVFELIGVRDFQHLEFGEWLHAMVTYSLFEETEILKFCFFILDREKQGFVEKEEMHMLVNMLYHVDPILGPRGNVRIALDKMPVQADGKVEFWELELYHAAFPSLFYPAMRLQVKMHQTLWGERWWRRKRRSMQNQLERKRMQDLADARHEVERKERMRQARIRRKMGKLKYYLVPCLRANYERYFPKEEEPEPEPEEDEEERRKREAEKKAGMAKILQMELMNKETEEFKKYADKKAKQRSSAADNKDKKLGAKRVKKSVNDRRGRLEARRDAHRKVGRDKRIGGR